MIEQVLTHLFRDVLERWLGRESAFALIAGLGVFSLLAWIHRWTRSAWRTNPWQASLTWLLGLTFSLIAAWLLMSAATLPHDPDPPAVVDRASWRELEEYERRHSATTAATTAPSER